MSNGSRDGQVVRFEIQRIENYAIKIFSTTTMALEKGKRKKRS